MNVFRPALHTSLVFSLELESSSHVLLSPTVT
jgi:hypothetical protein